MIDVLFVVLAVLLGAAVLFYFVQVPVVKKKCGSCPHAEKNAASW